MRNIDGQTGWNLYTPLISLAGGISIANIYI